MQNFDATLTVNANFDAVAAGGMWSDNTGETVHFGDVTLYLTYDAESDEYYAELQAQHNMDIARGLVYTDNGLEGAVESFVTGHAVLGKLITACSGSEQGMQDDGMLSCDADLTFSNKAGMTQEQLKEMGFDID